MFAPEQDGGAWKCRFEIDWPEGRREQFAGGYDSMQAMVIALQLIAHLVYTSEHHDTGNLFLQTPGSGYGFPVMRDMRDMLIGDDAKYM
jgi:hypothetical protein